MPLPPCTVDQGGQVVKESGGPASSSPFTAAAAEMAVLRGPKVPQERLAQTVCHMLVLAVLLLCLWLACCPHTLRTPSLTPCAHLPSAVNFGRSRLRQGRRLLRQGRRLAPARVWRPRRRPPPVLHRWWRLPLAWQWRRSRSEGPVRGKGLSSCLLCCSLSGTLPSEL